MWLIEWAQIPLQAQGHYEHLISPFTLPYLDVAGIVMEIGPGTSPTRDGKAPVGHLVSISIFQHHVHPHRGHPWTFSFCSVLVTSRWADLGYIIFPPTGWLVEDIFTLARTFAGQRHQPGLNKSISFVPGGRPSRRFLCVHDGPR